VTSLVCSVFSSQLYCCCVYFVSKR